MIQCNVKYYTLLFFTTILMFFCGCCSECDIDRELPQSTNYSTSLTLACWIKDLELQQIVDNFNAQNESCKIEIYAFFDPEDPNDDVEIALKRMSVELMSGSQPDLFYLESMDVMSLVNANLLLDLMPFIESDVTINDTKYYTNIWSLFEHNNKLFEFIPCYQVAGVVGSRALLNNQDKWTLDSYTSFVKETGQSINLDRSVLLAYMIQFSLDEFIDIESGVCSFDTEAFLDWIYFLDQFPERSPDTSQIYPILLWGIADYKNIIDVLGTQPKILGYPSISGDNPCAMALSSFAISSNTSYKEECWTFLKFLLDIDVQTTIFRNIGFPISKDAMDASVKPDPV